METSSAVRTPAPDAPTTYLACGWSPRCKALLLDGPHAVAPERAPSILVSYPYLPFFLRNRPRVRLRSWCLDSGAYSVWNSGASIDLHEYTAVARDLLAADPLLDQVIALDVIGDWRAGLRNVEAMWAAGVPAVPTYHIGEPEDVLVGLARDYPKIAVGGVARLRGRKKVWYAQQVFARVWPCRVHGLAVGGEDVLMAAPWHSTDASNWEANPGRFGWWKAFGGRNLGIRGGAHDLRAEVAWYLELERLARHRWRREVALLSAAIPEPEGGWSKESGLRPSTSAARSDSA